MSIPITGIVLIPLGLLLIFLPWRYCLIGLMTFGMMSPAAVVNVGNFGLEPGYYMALLVIARTALSVMTQRFILNGFVLGSMRHLFHFLAIALLALFLALCFFQGVETLPGTAGFKSNAVQPFHLGRNNYTQLAYLFINLFLIYSLAHQGARRGFDNLLREWGVAISLGLCFAAFVCVWQFVSLYAGLPFPGDFFYSNAGYSRADSQTMVGLFRINGPFEEPSTLGYTFTGYLLFAWFKYRNRATAFSVFMIAACVFCILVSTSTTALVGLFLFGAIAGLDVISGRVAVFARRFTPAQLAALAAVFVGSIVGMILLAENWQAVSIILNNILFDKAESTSFQQRSFADFLALDIFVKTYGIGLGLGSHKANSLALTLLSNVGIAGVIAFVAFLAVLFRPATAGLARASAGLVRRAFAPFQAALLGLLVIHVFSNPNLSTLTLWLQVGGLLALQAALRKTVSVHAATPVPFDAVPLTGRLALRRSSAL